MTDDEGRQVLGDVDISTLSDSPGRLPTEAAGARVLNKLPRTAETCRKCSCRDLRGLSPA
jgi:hypothetical protein